MIVNVESSVILQKRMKKRMFSNLKFISYLWKRVVKDRTSFAQ